MLFGTLSDAIKETARGRGDEYMDRWGDSEGIKDNLWGGILRSPLMAGPSATLTELASVHLGGHVNEAVGVDIFKESNTRFQQNQQLWSVFGPAAGLFAGTVPSMVQSGLAGEGEDFYNKATKRTPITNTVWFQYLNRMYNEEF